MVSVGRGYLVSLVILTVCSVGAGETISVTTTLGLSVQGVSKVLTLQRPSPNHGGVGVIFVVLIPCNQTVKHTSARQGKGKPHATVPNYEVLQGASYVAAMCLVVIQPKYAVANQVPPFMYEMEAESLVMSRICTLQRKMSLRIGS